MLGLMTHVIVLTIVFILPEVIFTAAMGQRAKFGPRRFDIYIHTVMYIITFYVNYFILIDRLLFKKRTWLYLVVAALFAALMVVASSYSHIVIDKLLGVTPPPHRRGHHGGGLFIVSMMTRDYVMLILTIGLSVALKMGLRWTRIEKLNERIITERKDMELRNLKNQLNPHFLFNTLNNIYALTAFDTEKAQNAIHQLSKLLRYTLYESDGTQVTLDKELQFIRSYINLMALRLSDNIRLTVSIPDGGTNGLEIAPMMFISLVETPSSTELAPARNRLSTSASRLTATASAATLKTACFRSKSQTKAARASDLPTCSANWSCSTTNATTTAPPPSATATWQSYR